MAYKFFLLLTRWKRSELLMVFVTIFLVLLGFVLLDSLVRTAFDTVSREAKPLFGGDIRIESAVPFTKDQKTKLSEISKDKNFEYVERTGFYTTLSDKAGNVGLVRVLAVSNNYPLYGNLTFEGLSEKTQRVLANEETFKRFSQDNTIQLWSLKVEITGILKQYPESTLAFWDEGNIVMLPIDLLSGTKLSDIGSRIDYDILIKTKRESDIPTVIAMLSSEKFFNGKKIESYTQDTGRVESILNELGDYVRIVLIAVVMLAGLWLYFVFDAYFTKLWKDLALFRILGLTKLRAIVLFSLFFLFLFLLSGTLSLFVSYALSSVFSGIPVLGTFQIFNESVITAILSSALLFVFSLFIPLFSTLENSPLSGLSPASFGGYTPRETILSAFSVSLLSVALYTILVGPIQEGLIFTAILLVGIGAIALVIKLLLLGFFWLIQNRFREKDFEFYDAIRSNVRPGSRSILVMTASILAFSVISVFLIISLHFLDRFELRGRQDTNIYVLNILDKEAKAIEGKFGTQGFYSVLRARILSINGKKLSEHLGLREPSREFSREFNLTTSTINTSPVISWKMDIQEWEVSVDEEFAKRLGVKLGDIIEFQLAGKAFTLKIASLRGSDTTGTNPFFYFQVDQNAFSKAPKTYFLARYVTDLESFKKEIYALTGPHISFVDVSKILQEILKIAERVVSMIFVFLTYVGIFVSLLLIAATYSSKQLRWYKESLYKTLGADRFFIKNNRFYSLAYPLYFSILLGSVIAIVSSFFIIRQMPFLRMDLHFFIIPFTFALILILVSLLVFRIIKRQ